MIIHALIGSIAIAGANLTPDDILDVGETTPPKRISSEITLGPGSSVSITFEEAFSSGTMTHTNRSKGYELVWLETWWKNPRPETNQSESLPGRWIPAPEEHLVKVYAYHVEPAPPDPILSNPRHTKFKINNP